MMNRWIYVFVAVGLAAALWVSWRRAASPGDPSPSRQAPAGAQALMASPRPPAAPVKLRRAALETPVVLHEPHSHEPHRGESQDARPPSHPLTEEHRKIQHELELLRQLDDAYDRQDHEAMRSLLEVYRDHHTGDVHAMQSGYAVLADCLDPSLADDEATLVHAWAYYEDERASTLRRFVRRSCLER